MSLIIIGQFIVFWAILLSNAPEVYAGPSRRNQAAALCAGLGVAGVCFLTGYIFYLNNMTANAAAQGLVVNPRIVKRRKLLSWLDGTCGVIALCGIIGAWLTHYDN